MLVPIALSLGLALFWAVLVASSRRLDLTRYGLHVKPPILRIEIPQLFRLSHRLGASRAGRVIGDIAIAMGIGQMLLASYTVITDVLELFVGRPRLTFLPLIPGVTFDLDQVPYILLAVAVILVSHELAHGCILLAEGVPVKSIGVFLALAIPGGYIEHSEEDFKRRPPSSRLRVLSVGSMANLLVSLGGLLLFDLLVSLRGPFRTLFGTGPLIGALTALYWIVGLSLGTALVNMLPIYPFDGALVLQVIVEGYGERARKMVKYVLSAV
ncbi:TPA: hypothetical protein EYP44_00255, partial [Candidatus Bathyarchaeota archaeon]|nr:hypothetical protein [Candidatus Bathyarchaeota archaeon]